VRLCFMRWQYCGNSLDFEDNLLQGTILSRIDSEGDRNLFQLGQVCSSAIYQTCVRRLLHGGFRSYLRSWLHASEEYPRDASTESSL
jgi:hypothetical protein